MPKDLANYKLTSLCFQTNISKYIWMMVNTKQNSYSLPVLHHSSNSVFLKAKLFSIYFQSILVAYSLS